MLINSAIEYQQSQGYYGMYDQQYQGQSWQPQGQWSGPYDDFGGYNDYGQQPHFAVTYAPVQGSRYNQRNEYNNNNDQRGSGGRRVHFQNNDERGQGSHSGDGSF